MHDDSMRNRRSKKTDESPEKDYVVINEQNEESRRFI